MWRHLILLLSLAAAPAMARPQAIAIPAHPAEHGANGPATLNAVLWPPAGRTPYATIVLLHGCAGMNTRGCRTLSERREPWQPVAPVLLLVGEADD
jgi:poly(3-hydroxybutyrate) depolymerase